MVQIHSPPTITLLTVIVIPHRSAARYQTRQYARKKKLLRIFQVLQSRAFKLHLYFRRARVRAALRAVSERPRRPFVRAARREPFEREARDRRRAAVRACFCKALRDAALEPSRLSARSRALERRSDECDFFL